jgi:hypothetical protein
MRITCGFQHFRPGDDPLEGSSATHPPTCRVCLTPSTIVGVLGLGSQDACGAGATGGRARNRVFRIGWR